MRKSILLLVTILCGCLEFLCHATEPVGDDEYVRRPPYIDESSVIFDYTPTPGYTFQGPLTFKAIIPTGINRIIVRRSGYHDHLSPHSIALEYHIAKVCEVDINSNVYEIEVSSATWGTYFTFQAITEDGKTIYSTNVIYTDDYMKPEDVAVFKPTSGGE